MLEKSQKRVKAEPIIQSPFQKLNVGTSGHKLRKNRYQRFVVMSIFA